MFDFVWCCLPQLQASRFKPAPAYSSVLPFRFLYYLWNHASFCSVAWSVHILDCFSLSRRAPSVATKDIATLVCSVCSPNRDSCLKKLGCSWWWLWGNSGPSKVLSPFPCFMQRCHALKRLAEIAPKGRLNDAAWCCKGGRCWCVCYAIRPVLVRQIISDWTCVQANCLQFCMEVKKERWTHY